MASLENDREGFFYVCTRFQSKRCLHLSTIIHNKMMFYVFIHVFQTPIHNNIKIYKTMMIPLISIIFCSTIKLFIMNAVS